MNYEYKIKTIILLNHLIFGLAVYYAQPEWFILSFIGWIIFGKIGGEIALHRYMCHKSFITGKIRHYILVLLSVFDCQGTPIAWCGVHRKHHAKSETEEDPHGAQSSWRIWSTFWKPFKIERKYIVDLIKDPVIKFVHNNYFKILLGTYILLALIDWRIPAFLISIPAVIAFHSSGLVNVFCHNYGYRHFDTKDHSTNNLIVNMLTLGSGLHNTHHAKPNSWNNKIKWWEIDLPGSIIKYFLIKVKN